LKNNNNFEFSRTVDLNSIKLGKTRFEDVEASAEECEKLIDRLGVKLVNSLKSNVKISKVSGGDYFKVEGTIDAEFVQTSAISMEELKTKVQTSFNTLFTMDCEIFNAADGGAYDEIEDVNSPIHRGILDLGELVVQYISLEIDPYLRSEGEVFDEESEIEEKNEKPNPFSVLEKLKDKK